jgi:DNA-binding MarR family transcriptional regulator
MPRKSSASVAEQSVDHAQKAIGFQLSRVMAVLRREVDTRMQAHGLTHAQWRPLWLLKMGLAQTANELARELDVDTSAVTRLVDRLEAKQLVARTRSGEDRRVVHLALTRSGEQAVSHIPGVLAEVNAALLAGFTADETSQLRDMLTRMQHNGGGLASDPAARAVSGKTRSSAAEAVLIPARDKTRARGRGKAFDQSDELP